jgi:hypothetical protein
VGSRYLLHALSVAAVTQTGSSGWLLVGWVFLAAGVLSFLVIFGDIVRGYRQHMAVMNWVYPITALYWGPVAVFLYFTRGRRMSARWAREHRVDLEQMMSPDEEQDPPSYWAFARKNWWAISKGVSHCGAGCTLGDITGEWIVYVTSLTIGGFALAAANSLCAMFILDFFFAWTYGVAFQYCSIVPMRDDLGPLSGIWAAIKADTLSILSFQVGLFGFMALFHLVFFKPPLTVASPTYWFMMQMGMIIGFFTAWPVNTWLIRRGWKEKM